MQKRPGSTGAVTCSGVHERELAGKRPPPHHQSRLYSASVARRNGGAKHLRRGNASTAAPLNHRQEQPQTTGARPPSRTGQATSAAVALSAGGEPPVPFAATKVARHPAIGNSGHGKRGPASRERQRLRYARRPAADAHTTVAGRDYHKCGRAQKEITSGCIDVAP